MHKIFTIILILLTLTVFSQKSPTEEAQPIVAEGKLLYKSEMASWYGTDIFMEKHPDKENGGGPFRRTAILPFREFSFCLTCLQVGGVCFTALAHQVVIHALAFDQRVHTGALNGRDVYKHVLAAVARLNEAIALNLIEPLYCS